MKKNKRTLVKKEYTLPFILVTSLFFLWGFARNFLDVFNKYFQEELVISRTQSSLFQVVFFLGYFLMAIPAGLLIVRKGYRHGVVFGLLLFAIGSLMFIPGSIMMDFNFFLASLFVIACGLVFLETAANPYMTELGDPETAASRLNLSQTFNGLGAACGPVIGGLFLFSDTKEANIALPYTIIGIFVLTVAFIFTRAKLPEIKDAESETNDNQNNTNNTTLKNNKLFVLGLCALLAYEIAEISINSSFINFAVDDAGLNKLTASHILGICLILFMCGRFVGSWAMRYVRAEKALLFCAFGTVATTTLVICNFGIVSFMALALIYIFEAIMFPTIFTLCIGRFQGNTKKAASYLMMTPIGGAIGTFLVFKVADGTSMSFSFIVPLLSYLIVLIFALVVERQKAQTEKDLD